MNAGGAAPDPREGRFDRLGSALRLTQLAVALVAAAALLSGSGGLSDALAVIALGVLVASAPVRVAWLGQRWMRRGDRLYGSLAIALFVVPFVGLALSVYL